MDEMPIGRKPIKTWLVPTVKRKNAYEWIEKQIKENLLFKKPTGYGLHVSLNHEHAKEIKERISRLLGVRID